MGRFSLAGILGYTLVAWPLILLALYWAIWG